MVLSDSKQSFRAALLLQRLRELGHRLPGAILKKSQVGRRWRAKVHFFTYGTRLLVLAKKTEIIKLNRGWQERLEANE